MNEDNLSKSQLKKLAKKNAANVETNMTQRTSDDGNVQAENSESASKSNSIAEFIQKRLKAISKKLQRISAMENLTNLNADQLKVIAGKSSLEGAQKELNDLATAIALGSIITADEQKQAPKDETLPILLQFLHLASVVASNENSSFYPAGLKSISNEEKKAIEVLKDQITNGPLLGGHGDALQIITNLVSGSKSDIAHGVNYDRVLQLIHAMSAPPQPSPEQTNEINFLGASEIESAEQSEKVDITTQQQTEQLGDYVEVAPAAFIDATIDNEAVSMDKMSMSWADEVDHKSAPKANEASNLPAVPASLTKNQIEIPLKQETLLTKSAPIAEPPHSIARQADEEGFFTVPFKKRSSAQASKPNKTGHFNQQAKHKSGQEKAGKQYDQNTKATNGSSNGKQPRGSKN